MPLTRRRSSSCLLSEDKRAIKVSRQISLLDDLLSEIALTQDNLMDLANNYVKYGNEELDGEVNEATFINLFHSIGYSNDEFLKDLFDSYDVLSTESVDFREVLFSLFKMLPDKSVKDIVKLVFRAYDVTGKGELERDNLRDAIKAALSRGTDLDPDVISVSVSDLFRESSIGPFDVLTLTKATELISRDAIVSKAFITSDESSDLMKRK